MKKTLLTLVLLTLAVTLTLGLISCGGDSCDHIDTNADFICDDCGDELENNATPPNECQHRDANDDSLCDKCSEEYTDGDEAHEHNYTVMNVADKYLATEANCKNAATYFYSCSCGEAGSVIFTYGTPEEHKYELQNTDAKYLASVADCKNAAKYFYSCTCGEKGTDTFESGSASNYHNTSSGKCPGCGLFESSSGLEFEINSDNQSYTVTGMGSCADVNIVLGLYNGLPVTAIAAESFCGEDIVSIIIPEGVTSIGWSAFEDCSSLTNVTLPDSLEFIGANAFRSCDNIKWHAEYENAYYLGNESNPYLMLLGAKSESITSCTINSNTKFINDKAFRDCTQLATITIPNGVKSIGCQAFSGSAIKNITIPESVKSIGSYAFPESMEHVTFENPNGWSYVEIPSGVEPEGYFSSTDLQNFQTAAEYLSSTYRKYGWICAE